MTSFSIYSTNTLASLATPRYAHRSRSVLREKFSAVVRKPVFTFYFDRFMNIDAALFQKLKKAREMRAVVVASPTSIKSFMLKFVEMMRHLEHEKNSANANKGGGIMRTLGLVAQSMHLKSRFNEVDAGEAYFCKNILEIFRSGVLMLDEVDLILHPLKSELNWPLGHKAPLDFTRSQVLGAGVRWDVQWFLFDAIFSVSHGMTVAFKDSMQAINTLKRIKAVIKEGIRTKTLQESPHLVLLSQSFYTMKLLPLLAEWLLLYLRSKKISGVDDKFLMTYMIVGPSGSSEGTSKISIALSDEGMKLVNLCHDLLTAFIPFLLGKVDRVNYGLLSKEQVRIKLWSYLHITLH